jgi:hypothetical protein
LPELPLLEPDDLLDPLLERPLPEDPREGETDDDEPLEEDPEIRLDEPFDPREDEERLEEDPETLPDEDLDFFDGFDL